jgi:hypothetical protein
VWVKGGNRGGKSWLLSQWLIASAAGSDAQIDGYGDGPVYWVKRWLARNCLPTGVIRNRKPGLAVIGGVSYEAQAKQIEPIIKGFCPKGTRFSRWGDDQNAGKAVLPGGGVIACKAYNQDPTTWEGWSAVAVGLDETPPRQDIWTGCLARLMESRGAIVMASTHMGGTGSWVYKLLEQNTPENVHIRYLYGVDNPHQDAQWIVDSLSEKSGFQRWQVLARLWGEIMHPEGLILPFVRATHLVKPFDIPHSWLRISAYDWSPRHPHCVWMAERPSDGVIFVYREYAPRLTTSQRALRDREFLAECKRLEAAAGEDDPAIEWLRVGGSDQPAAMVDAAELGWYLLDADRSAGAVDRRITEASALMATVDPAHGPCEPRLFVFEGRCPVLVEEIEGWRWAEPRPGVDPHPDRGCSDHGPEAMTYGLAARAAA